MYAIYILRIPLIVLVKLLNRNGCAVDITMEYFSLYNSHQLNTVTYSHNEVINLDILIGCDTYSTFPVVNKEIDMILVKPIKTFDFFSFVQLNFNGTIS